MAILARNIKKLPKWAIKQAGGINKKAWRLARRGSGTGGRRFKRRAKKVARRRKRGKLTRFRNRKSMGIVGKLNAGLRGLRLGLPAIGSAMTHGLNEQTPRNMLGRYSGFDMEQGKFTESGVKKAAGFYAGNIIEAKAMGMMKIPQMAGKKKLLAVAANFLPEITAVPHAASGNFGEAVNQLGRASIGYQATDHQSWIENGAVRDEWLKNLGARVGIGLFSRFVGPFVNKHLPKGVNI